MRTDLYRVDVAAPGMATKINADLVADGNVVGFHIREDGTHVGYVANQDDAEVYELYETNLAAPGTATKLSAAMSWWSFTVRAAIITFASMQLILCAD